MNKKEFVVTLIALTLLVTTSCTPALQVDVARADAARITAPDVSPADREALVRGNTAFALDLYQVLRNEPGNLFFSPYSISIALAMTHAGARGETERQMAETLHYALPQEQLHAAFNALDQALAGRSGEEGALDLDVVNSIWGQRGYSFLPDFLTVLASHYDAGIRLLDFENAPEEARVTINDWVAQETRDRIEDLIPQGVIDEMTRMVLVNAIYFNARWMHTFDPRRTQEGPFYLLDGSQVTAPMMEQTEIFGYVAGDGYQAIQLSYEGSAAMLILLPDAGRFDEFEAALDADRMAGILDALDSTNITLSMPRFEFESDFSLSDALVQLGMRDAFLPSQADLSGIDGTRLLYIQDVIHKAFVAVDERGTEAAAATAVVVGATSAPPPPIEVRIDRPFIFAIRDVPTGSILFVGRVLNPSG